MWPHSAVLALGDDLVVVGSDDPRLALRWRPWTVDDDEHPDAHLVDYGIETKIDDESSSAVRPLATVRHGSVALGRSQDVDALIDAFWRILGSWAAPAGPGSVRVDAVPVLTASGIVLVDRSVGSLLPQRRLADLGTPVVPVHHVDVDIDDGDPRITIAAPLVGEGETIAAPLIGWLTAAPGAEHVDSRAERTALLARALVETADGPEGRRRIDALARIATSIACRPVDGGRAGLVDAVCALADTPPG